MSGDAGLLPLPFSPYLVSEWTGPSMMDRKTWTAYTAEQMEAYARANLAAMQAEVERWRKDSMDSSMDYLDVRERLDQSEARAERLAEALREKVAEWRKPRADDECTLYTMGKRDGRHICADEIAALQEASK